MANNAQEDTGTQLSQATFDGINWLFFSLSLIALCVRLYIRITAFRKIIVEDYLMLATLCMLIADEALGQRFSATIYYFMSVTNGTMTLTTVDQLAAFLDDASSMLKGLGSAIIFFLIALYVVKANFMFFFRRLGSRAMPRFYTVWWAAFAVVMACGIVSVCMGVPTFRCLFNGIAYTLQNCESAADQEVYFTYFRVTVALDIITDALIIAFPVWILWGVRISLHKKLALTGIFSLVGLTIVATILRGALLSSVFEESATGRTINIPWIWFWFHIELCISVIVACLVSFRSLFIHSRTQQSSSARRRAEALRPRSGHSPYPPGGNSSERTPRQSGNASRVNLALRRQFKVWGDSVLDTCRTLEGMDFDHDGATLVDEEREMPELNRDVEATHNVREEPSAGQQDPAVGQHRGELPRQPSIDSLLVIEDRTSTDADRIGRRGSAFTCGNGSSASSQHRRLSVDSLHQEHSSDMEVSPLSSRDG
ncbi:hypothetical protein N0V82_001466 [Gnomoniopsis sp. IMI 355080]|nr:hypothetical protein N0V82_001466 [Gnomoniopsis sp. IMI 355080]